MDWGLPALQFLLCAVLIARAGFVLSQSAERIAAITGMGAGWVGLAMLATVTSLPELASGISAVTLVGAPDLAVGNLLGACLFNLLFLAVVEVLQRARPLYQAAGPVHLLSAAFGVVMLGFVALSLLAGSRVPALLHVGVYSPLLLAGYLLALRSVRRHEAALAVDAVAAGTAAPLPTTLAFEWRRFAVAAMVVLVAGSWLPGVADQLAAALGWSRSFAGTLLMALATTLPEMAVTLSALRLGALDMAVGNLLGSNLFNITILAVVDLAWLRGPLLADASPAHAGTAATAVVMSGLVIVGLVLRPHTRVARLVSWVGVGLLAVWLANAALIFLYGG